MTLVQLDSTVVSKTADVGSSPTCRAEREVTSPSDALFGQFQRRREIKLTAAPFGWTRTLGCALADLHVVGTVYGVVSSEAAPVFS